MNLSKLVIILLLMCTCFNTFAQVNDLGPKSSIITQDAPSQIISRNTVRLLTIGIRNFNDNDFVALNSVSSLDGFKIVSEDYLRLSYRNHPAPTFLNKSIVKVAEVRKALSDLAEESNGSDVIIISILSHGVVVNGEFYLVCSDTDGSDYSGTALSGTEIRKYLELMANKGAVVLLFLDTCHAAALFENILFSPDNNGSIAFFASSQSDEKAKEIGQRCRFTEAVINIFQNKIGYAFVNGFVTIKTLNAQINAALEGVPHPHQQHPVFKHFSKNDHFINYPIIKEKELIPSPSIWQNPSPFVPWAVSPNKGNGLDYILIGVEGASLASMVLCGPILQSYYKNKISKETNVFKRNEYRQKGKKASIVFCTSTAILFGSYIGRTLHVRRQMVNEHKEKQFATLDIQPVLTSDFNGLSLVLNF